MGGDFGADDLGPMRHQPGDGEAACFAHGADALLHQTGGRLKPAHPAQPRGRRGALGRRMVVVIVVHPCPFRNLILF